jgi:hypothetical protein
MERSDSRCALLNCNGRRNFKMSHFKELVIGQEKTKRKKFKLICPIL